MASAPSRTSLPLEELNVQRTILFLYACQVEGIAERIADTINRLPPDLLEVTYALLNTAEEAVSVAAALLRQKAEETNATG